MYFPSPLPTTRLSVSTSALPSGPTPAARPKLAPGRKSSGQSFRPGGGGAGGGGLGGVLEEEGEDVLEIVKGPSEGDGAEADDGSCVWAALGREELSVWTIRPKVVIAKLKRTPLSLRTHGSNASVVFRSPRQLVITTTSGHHLLYALEPLNHQYGGGSSSGKDAVYVVPGGDKGARAWPKGPGEGHELHALVLRSEGERGMAVGDGVGCVCITSHDMLVAVQDPPLLRILPFPVPAQSAQPHQQQPPRGLLSPAPRPQPRPSFSADKSRRGSGWESLPAHLHNSAGGGAVGSPASGADSEVVVLDEWDWLVGRDRSDVSISHLVALASATRRSTDSPRQFRARAQSNANSTPSRRRPTSFVMLTSDGRAYIVRWAPPPMPSEKKLGKARALDDDEEAPDVLFDEKRASEEETKWTWIGECFHPALPASSGVNVEEEECRERELDKGKGASTVGVNEKMGLVAVGCEDGSTAVYHLPPAPTAEKPTLLAPAWSHDLALRAALNTTASGLDTGRVTCLAWTSDGHALAIGYSLGWALWSVYGRLGSWSVSGSLGTDSSSGRGGADNGGYGVEGEKSDAFEDHFMAGVKSLFWSPGNLELFVLCPPPVHPKKKPHDEQLFVIPFAKSAVTGVHTPDNTKHAFLQMDDRVLVYRGADQPDMSVINPESDVWQHIKIPASYIALQHPIRFAVISSDARLIAVAGQRGLTHYNALSGRWKLFETDRDEDAIRVVGGMAWWSNVLIVGCVEGGSYQLRLFSRDKPLSLADSLEVVHLASEPLLISVFDSSLLVYTADNTFHHYLIRHTKQGSTRLKVCGSIGFEGVVSEPKKVRGMSWLVPKSQQRFGDPADDLNVATIIFLISGKLVLLRPRRAAHEEVKYDMQVLAERIEFYWTHLSGIGTLENSLWGWDGKQIRIWLDALTIEKVKVDARRDAYESVTESVAIALDFYPLAVLMEKAIIVGVDQETSLRRTLDFAIFRIITTTHLFIHHILRFHLSKNQRREAVVFASHYQHLVYFAHALEILLHAVLEDEADAKLASRPSTPGGGLVSSTTNDAAILPRVVEFLDHFEEALQVVVGCARKTEMARWEHLFEVVGKPRDLFEKCIASGFLKVAASYLLVLHNLDSLEQSSQDTVRLLKTATEAGEWTLCRELLRFLYSLDRSGSILRAALTEGQALPPGYQPQRVISSSAPHAAGTQSSFRSGSMPSRPPERSAQQGFGSLLGRVG